MQQKNSYFVVEDGRGNVSERVEMRGGGGYEGDSVGVVLRPYCWFLHGWQVNRRGFVAVHTIPQNRLEKMQLILNTPYVYSINSTQGSLIAVEDFLRWFLSY